MADYFKSYYKNGPYRVYEYETITVSGGIENYDLKTNTNLFSDVIQAEYMEVSCSGSGLSMKLNGSANTAIPIVDEWSISDFMITNLFITNEGVETDISIFMKGYR